MSFTYDFERDAFRHREITKQVTDTRAAYSAYQYSLQSRAPRENSFWDNGTGVPSIKDWADGYYSPQARARRRAQDIKELREKVTGFVQHPIQSIRRLISSR